MRAIILTLVCLLSSLPLMGQADDNSSIEPLPKFYVGVGAGVNSFTGILGLSGTINVTDHVALRGAAGIGAWGYRFTFGINGHKDYRRGWNYGLSYSYYSGIADMKLDMEVNSGDKEKVTLDYLPTGTINFTLARSWRLGRKNSFYLETGYAKAIQNKPWKVSSGQILSPTSNQVMNIVRPGGLMFGVGFTFGL